MHFTACPFAYGSRVSFAGANRVETFTVGWCVTGITVADLEPLFGIHVDPDLYRLMKVLRVLDVSLELSVVSCARN